MARCDFGVVSTLWGSSMITTGFVARTTSFDHKQSASLIKRAISHRGFSVVDILTSCPTYFGRMNEVAEPYDMVHYLRDTSTPLHDCTCGESDAPAPELMPTGIFREEVRTDYESLYRQKVAAASAGRRSTP